MKFYSKCSDAFYFLLDLPYGTWVSIFLTIVVVIVFFIERRRMKRILLALSLILFLCINNEFIANYLLEKWETRERPIAEQKFETGIVPGGFVSANYKGQPFLNSEAHRFYEAIKLYKQGVIKKIIITGGFVAGNSVESVYAREEAIKQGVCEEDVFAENQSMTTYENAIFTKRKMDSLHIDTNSLLITSSLHLTRATSVFQKAGITVTPYPSDVTNYGNATLLNFSGSIKFLMSYTFIVCLEISI